MIDTSTRNQSCCQAPEASCSQSNTTYKPRFDIWETDDELVLLGDLPGVLPEDVDVRYENPELTICGKVTPRHEQGTPRCSEYGVGDFQRSFTVADTIDADRISAELKNGVLTLHLPEEGRGEITADRGPGVSRGPLGHREPSNAA